MSIFSWALGKFKNTITKETEPKIPTFAEVVERAKEPVSIPLKIVSFNGGEYAGYEAVNILSERGVWCTMTEHNVHLIVSHEDEIPFYLSSITLRAPPPPFTNPVHQAKPPISAGSEFDNMTAQQFREQLDKFPNRDYNGLTPVAFFDFGTQFTKQIVFRTPLKTTYIYFNFIRGRGTLNMDIGALTIQGLAVIPPTISVAPPSHSEFLSFLASERWSDCRFVVEGKVIPAHKLILYARCDRLRAMFESSMKDSDANEFKVDDGVEYSIFMEFLRYVYTGADPEFGEDWERALKLAIVADQFAVERLKNLCEEQLIKNLNSETVGAIFQFAVQYSIPQLQKVCAFYLRSIENLVSLELSEELAAEYARLKAPFDAKGGQ